ncbi:hypothetical protein THAOC_18446, partial [Thalassiosira oceanica]
LLQSGHDRERRRRLPDVLLGRRDEYRPGVGVRREEPPAAMATTRRPGGGADRSSGGCVTVSRHSRGHSVPLCQDPQTPDRPMVNVDWAQTGGRWSLLPPLSTPGILVGPSALRFGVSSSVSAAKCRCYAIVSSPFVVLTDLVRFGFSLRRTESPAPESAGQERRRAEGAVGQGRPGDHRGHNSLTALSMAMERE